MIDHISLGVRDIAASTLFYERVLAPLGYEKMSVEAHTVGFGKSHREFWLNSRPDMPPVPEESGTHVCLRAPNEEAVQAFHRAALEAGGRDDGAPGPRPQYSETYYGAFVRDPDGHRIEAVTFLSKT